MNSDWRCQAPEITIKVIHINLSFIFHIFIIQAIVWLQKSYKMAHKYIYDPFRYFLKLGRPSPHSLSSCGKELLGHYAKHLLLCSKEESKSFGFGTAWGRVHDDNIFLQTYLAGRWWLPSAVLPPGPTNKRRPSSETHTHLNQISPPLRTHKVTTSLGHTKNKSVQF